MRNLAIIAGCIIIAATAHVAIVATGGYAAPSAPLQIAIALGLCVGAVCLGMAWSDRRWGVAFVLFVALLAGEGFAVINTAERTIAARDAVTAPARDAEAMRTAATARVITAEAAKVAADAAALTEAAKRGCRKECRTLIEGAKADAKRELDAARTSLAGLPTPRSAAPLAERLGLPAWLLDVIAAALASISANGLGAALIAFGAHRGRAQEAVAALPVVPAPIRATTPEPAHAAPLALPAPSPRDHAAQFGLEMLSPGATSTPVVRLHSAYQDWCRDRGHDPLPAREIGGALLALFERSGLQIEEIDGTPHVLGAKIKAGERRALGSLARIA